MNVAIASVALLLLAGCAAAPEAGAPVIQAGGEVVGVRDGETALSVGQTLSISLGSNSTTGYQWSVSDFDEAILTPQEPFGQEMVDDHAPGMVGVGGATRWRFTAARPGTVILRFGYSRPWLTDAPPAETAIYRIVVR